VPYAAPPGLGGFWGPAFLGFADSPQAITYRAPRLISLVETLEALMYLLSLSS